jgi:glycosyltransferase involved in cell wall biosynthesis
MNVESYEVIRTKHRLNTDRLGIPLDEIPAGRLRPIPVLLTVRELHYGGIQGDVTKIALSLDRTRFEPHVATYQIDGMHAEELNRAGVPVLHIPMTSLKSPSAIFSAMRLRSYIRRHGIRLVHAFDTSAVFVVPLARALRVPAVLASTLGNRKLLDRRSHRQMRWTDRMVDTVVVNCEAMRRHLIDDEHVPGERIELCYNGLVTTEFFPENASRPNAIANASLVIGTVCVLRPEKALTLLQEAFLQVRHLDPNMKLVFVGSGPLLGSLRENASRLGIAEANVFIPATHDVATWLRSMDIFVLPSYSEAFSNSLLEAMACGCAVVGSLVGGTPELIGNNEERGLLFRNGDAGDLALKLSKLIAETEFRRSLGNRASEFVRENLTIEIAAERTAQIYEKMLKHKSGHEVTVSMTTEENLDAHY